MTRSTRARGVRAAVAAVVLAVTVVGGAPPASAGPRSDAAYAVALANGLREGNGVAPLAVDRHLAAVAAYWAAELAWNGDLAHNPTLTYQVGGWWVLGENVGYGGSVEAVHSAWLDSWSHYLNLVEPEYTHIGVGRLRRLRRSLHRRGVRRVLAGGGHAPLPAPLRRRRAVVDSR